MEFAAPADLFKQVVEGAQEAIITADTNGVLRFWNPAGRGPVWLHGPGGLGTDPEPHRAGGLPLHRPKCAADEGNEGAP